MGETAPPARAPAPPSAPPPEAPERSLIDRALVPVVVVAVVLLVSGVLSQLVTPFIRRDDWPFLLPPDVPGIADPLAKVRGEGRWLSYGWWLGVGRHGSPVSAALVMFGAYTLFVVGLWRLFDVRGRVSGILLGLALMLSPLWIRLIYWPGTLSASAIVAAAGVWTLPAAARRPGRLAAWVVVTTILSVLTYPPVGGLLLIAAAVHLRHRPWKHVLLLCVTFGASFGLGVALSIILGRIAFGQWGFTIAEWRHPNSLASLHDLRVNAGRYKRQLIALRKTLPWPSLVVVVTVLVGLVDARVRPTLLKVAAAVAVVAGMECAQTLLTGVRTNVRGSLWAWVAIVIFAGLLLAGRAWSRRVGQVALAVLALIGVLAWRNDIAIHQTTRQEYAAIVSDATAIADRTGGQVVFQQRSEERRTARGSITAGTLRAMFYEHSGTVVRWCRGEECRRLAELAPQGPVHDLGPVIGVVVPAPPKVL